MGIRRKVRREIYGFLGIAALGLCLCDAACGQFANSSIWSTPDSTIAPSPVLIATEAPLDETLPEFGPTVRLFGAAPAEVRAGEPFVAVAGTARGAVVADSTRLNPVSKGSFLPSAIPVEGNPFFDSKSRASVQGSGTSLELLGGIVSPNTDMFLVGTRLLVEDASFGTDDSGLESNVVIQQAYASYNGLLVGQMDTAISDPEALPEILDLAGPNARVTVLQNGTDKGQGRISYYILRPENEGLTLNLSIENPTPEINRPQGAAPGSRFDTFARFPDLLLATRYIEGEYCNTGFVEEWHIQFGMLGRSLGLENDDGSFDQQEFGWGTVLSGSYWWTTNGDLSQRDAVFGSIAYGQGIGHYIVDLRAESATIKNNDAVVNTFGQLEALPAFAWYAAYMHSWTNHLRSTVTYSFVHLDSIQTPTQVQSPYRQGQFVQANLVYHSSFKLAGETAATQPHLFFTGLEWSYGRKEVLDGSSGDAHRLMWLVAFKK